MKTTENGKTRKSKTPRTLVLIEAPAAQFDGYGALKVTEGKKVDTYLFRQIPADFGEGFQVEKLGPDLATVEVYDVNLAGQASTCTCKGHTYCGHCRHVEGLLALDSAGKLPRPVRQKVVACNRCQRLVEAPGLCDACQEEDDYYTACDQAAEMEAAGMDPWAEWDASAFANDAFVPVDADF